MVFSWQSTRKIEIKSGHRNGDKRLLYGTSMFVSLGTLLFGFDVLGQIIADGMNNSIQKTHGFEVLLFLCMFWALLLSEIAELTGQINGIE